MWRIITASETIRGSGIDCSNQLTVAVQPVNQFSVVNGSEVCSITTIVRQFESEDSVFCTIRPIQCRERLGGMLNFYYREAA
jgi:hypothetical protein